MKRLIVCLCVVICLVGCDQKKEEPTLYEQYVEELEQQTTFVDDYPFSIEASTEQITDDEVMYHVIIDSPQEALYQVKAMVIHDKKTEDIYPSIGVLDEPVNLVPGYINEEEGCVKGIALIGYLPYQNLSSLELSFRLMVEWQDQSGISHKIFILLPFDKENT